MAKYRWHGDYEIVVDQVMTLIKRGKQTLRDKSGFLSYSIQKDNSINISFQHRTFAHFWAKDVSEEDKALRDEIYNYIAVDCAFYLFGLADYGYTRSSWLQEWGLVWDDLVNKVVASYTASLPPLDLEAAAKVSVIDYVANKNFEDRVPGYYVVQTDGGDNLNIENVLVRYDNYGAAVSYASRRAKAGHFDTTDIVRTCEDGMQRFMSWVVDDDAKVFPDAERYRDAADECWLEANNPEPSEGKLIDQEVVRVRIVVANDGLEGIIGAYFEAADMGGNTSWYKFYIEGDPTGPVGFTGIGRDEPKFKPRYYRSFDYYYDNRGEIIGVDVSAVA